MRRVLASYGRLGLGVLFLSATCQHAEAFAGLSPLRLAHIPRSAALASLSPGPRLRQPYSRHVMTTAVVATGDLVAVKWGCTTADGNALPESARVFDQGSVRLVVGEGGYVPCLHKKVAGMKEGETAEFEVGVCWCIHVHRACPLSFCVTCIAVYAWHNSPTEGSWERCDKMISLIVVFPLPVPPANPTTRGCPSRWSGT